VEQCFSKWAVPPPGGGGDERGTWGRRRGQGSVTSPGTNRRLKLLDVCSGTTVEQEFHFLFAAINRCRFRIPSREVTVHASASSWNCVFFLLLPDRCRFRQAARPVYKRASIPGIANVAAASFVLAKRNPRRYRPSHEEAQPLASRRLRLLKSLNDGNRTGH
ncbi:hypothetical protein M514_05185, partial [Trichuris suis]